MTYDIEKTIIFFASLIILACFIAFFSWLLSLVNNPKSDHASDRQSKPNGTEEHSEDALPRHVRSIADAIHAYRGDRETHERNRSKNDSNNLIILSLTAAFAFLAAISAGVSAYFVSRQLDEMREEPRAWVAPFDANISAPPSIGADGVGNMIDATVNLQNPGRTPAKDVSYDLAVDAVDGGKLSFLPNFDIDEFVARCFKKQTASRKMVIYPQGENNFYNFHTKFPREMIDSDVVIGRRVLIIKGCVAYESLGKTRHSAYCYWYQSGVSNMMHLSICQTGNDAD